jgi:cell fate regulator YaaT (PSP1 superfamily)
MVDDSAVTLPLRALVRIATPEDCQAMQDNRKKEPRAFEICQQKIKEYNLDMKLVRVEYSFDGNKILFFFTSEGRVDFRELVKNLASIFRTRIELRQIGVRDEAKLLGGLGVCGKPFCCATFLDEFQPVSIKMAKTQNLSLNPVKISGTCGRLMCCLKYEQEAYEDLLKRAPKQESFVNTPEGTGTVSTVSLLREQVKVRLDAAPETPKCFRNEEISVIRSGKGKRPEGYDSPEEIRANWLKQMQEAALARQMEEAQARESARKAMESMGKKAEGKPSHEGRRRPEGQSQRPNPPKHPEQAGQEDAQQREQKPNHGKRRRPHRQKPRDQKPQEAKPQEQKMPEQKPREQKNPKTARTSRSRDAGTAGKSARRAENRQAERKSCHCARRRERTYKPGRRKPSGLFVMGPVWTNGPSGIPAVRPDVGKRLKEAGDRGVRVPGFIRDADVARAAVPFDVHAGKGVGGEDAKMPPRHGDPRVLLDGHKDGLHLVVHHGAAGLEPVFQAEAADLEPVAGEKVASDAEEGVLPQIGKNDALPVCQRVLPVQHHGERFLI